PLLHSSPSGGSTLITSAPKSDRIVAAAGPAIKLARSTTLSPEKILFSLIRPPTSPFVRHHEETKLVTILLDPHRTSKPLLSSKRITHAGVARPSTSHLKLV